jgi:RNA polymerase sigma factor (sigma-70 family)
MAEISETVKTDAALLKAYVMEQDEAAFGELACRHGPLVYRVCRGLLKDAHEAEDCTQAVFVVLMRKARSLRGEMNLAAWLYGVARHVSLHAAEARARRAEHEEGVAMARQKDRRAVETSAASSLMDLVYRELGALSKIERQAVLLRYLEGRSEKEAAEIAGCPQGTLSRRASNGMAKLRERLAKCGQTTTLSSFVSLLETSAQIPVPESLLSSTLTTTKLATTEAAKNAVHSLAKGVTNMMFWAKVKTAAIACAAVVLFGFGGPFLFHALSQEEKNGNLPAGETVKTAPTKPGEFRKEKDFAGREHMLDSSWKEGERPYRKDLATREAEYRDKHGENWAGELVWGSRQRIATPGKWDYEEVVLIPGAKKALPNFKEPGGHDSRTSKWGHGALVFAADGREVSDIYEVCSLGVYHVDTRTRAVSYIGSRTVLDAVKSIPGEKVHEKFKGMGDFYVFAGQSLPPALDGLEDKAVLCKDDGLAALDRITGRVFYAEPMGRGDGKAFRGPYKIRYVEKLLPYTIGGREMLLPAILESNELYKKVSAEPVIKDGQRAPARFAVRTTAVQGGAPVFGGWGAWGAQVALSMDGKTVYVSGRDGVPEGYDVASGSKLGPLTANKIPVPDGRDQNNVHGGSCGLFDNWFYNCTYQGTGPSPGLLFRVNMKDGKVETLYDSGNPQGRTGGKYSSDNYLWDGPGDAVKLTFSSTRYQTQCPRTGAIFNSGWDGAGLRRYHDGFVTTLADSSFRPHRPDWKDKKEPCAAFGNKVTPSIAPNGDMYLEGLTAGAGRFSDAWPEFTKGKDDIRIVRIFRTDWPKEQPVNGYANQFVSPEKREELMLDYCKKYIADYEERSKIY